MRRHPSARIDARGELLDRCIGMAKADEYAPFAKRPDPCSCACALRRESHQCDKSRISDLVEKLVSRVFDRRQRMRTFSGGREKWAFEVHTQRLRSPRCVSTVEGFEYIGICRVN